MSIIFEFIIYLLTTMPKCIASTVTFVINSSVPIEASPFSDHEIIHITPDNKYVYIDKNGNKFIEKKQFISMKRETYAPEEKKSSVSTEQQTSFEYQVSCDGFTWENDEDFPDNDWRIWSCSDASSHFFAAIANYFKSLKKCNNNISSFCGVDVYIRLETRCTKDCRDAWRQDKFSCCWCNRDLHDDQESLLDRDLEMFSFDKTSCSSIDKVACEVAETVDNDDIKYKSKLQSVLKEKFDVFFQKKVVRI